MKRLTILTALGLIMTAMTSLIAARPPRTAARAAVAFDLSPALDSMEHAHRLGDGLGRIDEIVRHVARLQGVECFRKLFASESGELHGFRHDLRPGIEKAPIESGDDPA